MRASYLYFNLSDSHIHNYTPACQTTCVYNYTWACQSYYSRSFEGLKCVGNLHTSALQMTYSSNSHPFDQTVAPIPFAKLHWSLQCCLPKNVDYYSATLEATADTGTFQMANTGNSCNLSPPHTDRPTHPRKLTLHWRWVLAVMSTTIIWHFHNAQVYPCVIFLAVHLVMCCSTPHE